MADSATSYAAFADSRVDKVKDEFRSLQRFCEKSDVRGTFLFFGSARAPSQEQHDAAKAEAVAKLEAAQSAAEMSEGAVAAAQLQLAKVQQQAWLPVFWEKTRELAALLTSWALSADGVRIGRAVPSFFPKASGPQPLVVCTGGGPGFMEAANKGAVERGGKSMGIGVVLPFETKLNEYVTPGMDFTADTFFSRKYWEVFQAKCMVCCPGGVGTCDEMFEVLTLMQCRKMPSIPVVLLGKEFWTTAVNLRYIAEKGLMSHAEIDALCITDSPEEACSFVVKALVQQAADADSPKQ